MNKNVLIGGAVIVGIGMLAVAAFIFFAPEKHTNPVSQTDSGNIPDASESLTQEPTAASSLGGLKAPSKNTSTSSSTSAISTTPAPKIKIIKQSQKGISATSTTAVKIEKKPLLFPLPPRAMSKPSIVPDQYIVILKKSPTQEKDRSEILKKYGIASMYQYTSGRSGFTAKFDTKKRDTLKNDTRIETVTNDTYVSVLEIPSPVRATSTAATSSQPIAVPPQSAALPTPGTQIVPNGIARILAQSSTFKGTGIGVAILDTGVDLTHPDLKGRIMADTSCIKSSPTGNDDNGHGTHAAGIIAANDNAIGVVGIAPHARIIAVKVLDAKGIGTLSSVLCGIDWVRRHAEKYNIKVVNMGFGGAGKSDHACGTVNHDPLHQALCQSTQTGITYIAAAGNESADAESVIPAAYSDTLITVSALTDTDGSPNEKGSSTNFGNDDMFANFSNFGNAVAIGAPGVDIVSTGKKGTYYAAHGTSMAAAHVAGMAALYIQSHPLVTWRDVKNALQLSGEHLWAGHSDTSGNHPENVLQVMVF